MYLNGRAFLQQATTLIATAKMFGFAPQVAANSRTNNINCIEFLALHTNEFLRVPLLANGQFLQPDLTAINVLFRDHRTNEIQAIDTALLVYLRDLRDVLQFDGPFHVISGFRSASTNALLRAKSPLVAKKSFHLTGRAVDIRVPGVASSDVRQAAIDLRFGGVGYYPRSDFVHLDTGRFRYW